MSRAYRVILATSVVASIAACASLKSAPDDAGAGVDGGEASVEAGEPSTFSIVRQADTAGSGAFRALWVGGPELVYVAGDNGVLLEKRPNDQWAEVALGSGVDVGGVWGAGPTEAFAVATTRNTNNGPIFQRLNNRWIQIGIAPVGLRSVWGHGNKRYAAGNDGKVYYGPPTQPLAEGNQFPPNEFVAKTNFAPILFSIGGNDENRVMIAADYDMTVFFDGTWHTYADPIDRTRSFRAIWGPPLPKGSGEIDIYQGANYFGLWHFTGSANPVTQLNEEKDEVQNFNRWIWGIWGPNADKIICVGDGGRIMTYDKKTGEVKKRPSPTTKSLFAIGGTSLDDIWIVGEDQLVLHGSLNF